MRLLERYNAITTVLAPYKNRDDIYITFTDLLKVGINPQYGHKTPLGIYAYPLKVPWEDVVRNEIPFAGERSYVHILQSVFLRGALR